MPPRRPPPLPQGLFAPSGPLAPGSAPLPPSPTTVHPSFVVDAHTFGSSVEDDIFSGLAASAQKPVIKGSVGVKLEQGEPAPYDGTIHPLVLDLSSSTPPTTQALSGLSGTVDIIVPAHRSLSEGEWDLLEETVSKLDGGWGKYETGDSGSQVAQDGLRIIISGILPPPLTKPSSPLLNDDAYGLHLARLASLSLHSNVYLKALPPILDGTQSALPAGAWWEDGKELERVLQMYVSPAIETFGTHRIIFGSAPALPADHLTTISKTNSLAQPIASSRWYAILRKIVTELGEGHADVTDIMGQNAVNVYAL